MDDGECGGWIWGSWRLLALQWLVVVGLCLHFQMFRLHQTLAKHLKMKIFYFETNGVLINFGWLHFFGWLFASSFFLIEHYTNSIFYPPISLFNQTKKKKKKFVSLHFSTLLTKHKWGKLKSFLSSHFSIVSSFSIFPLFHPLNTQILSILLYSINYSMLDIIIIF